MSNEDTIQQLINKIMDIAAVAGARGTVDPDVGAFVFNVGTNNGRKQTVYVRPTGEIAGGRPMITFFSIAKTYPKTRLLVAISNKELLNLLKTNENMPFARYGIQERKDDFLVVASADYLLETLDSDEFQAAATFVAMAADKYEAAKSEGGDEF